MKNKRDRIRELLKADGKGELLFFPSDIREIMSLATEDKRMRAFIREKGRRDTIESEARLGAGYW